MTNLLFIYGTLLNNDNKYGIYLKNNSRHHSSGKLKGKLYDIGEYPGAILSSGYDEYVDGYILQIDDPEKVLTVVDSYEGFGEDQPQPNEFIRVLVEVETECGRVKCWTYLYNLPITNLQWIKTGKYIK
ncbi:MAG: gamma-glutamylcyclotransferase [Mucilaginibacter sp.]|nr:gamma-glutamylcyclotransferase [Mucilaginibacter sp.]